MTIANQITILRILLIPVFVLFCAYYGRSVTVGAPDEALRMWAIAVFVFAAATDGLDGFIARHFHQKSRLGAVLDPIADKGLLLTAIVTLSFSDWHSAFPIWFPIVVIARDAVILAGCGILYFLDQSLEIRPSWTGKTATALQMVAIAWIMLQLPHPAVIVWAAGGLTLASGLEYLVRGASKLRHHSQPHP